ncbi:MAG: YtxH domain-containing protein [Nitrospira sp.]|jgi:gas vesicle protein|nr:YtxH domain-containing protein [Nitrospira sp.]MDH4356580.1 YtxH domain-containing protein [Nitrospira sp.]MDH5319939.1 YtxH domain-containing protein [Nitrospira sp.]
MREDCRCGEMAVMFLAGLTIGTMTGLLLAPHSGAYTRRQLQNLAEEVQEQASALASDAKEVVENAVGKGKRIVS